MLRDRGELTGERLEPVAGPRTIDKLVSKGWIEAGSVGKYRITVAGIAASKAKLPP